MHKHWNISSRAVVFFIWCGYYHSIPFISPLRHTIGHKYCISSVLLCNWWGMFLKFICLCSVCIGYSKTVICVRCPCGTVDAVLLSNFWLSVNVDKAGVTFSVPFFKDQTYAFLENCYLQPITGKIHRFLGNAFLASLISHLYFFSFYTTRN